MCIKRSYRFDSLPSFTPTFLNIWVHYLFMLLVYLKWWLFIAIWREVVLVCAFFYAAFSSSSVFLSLVLGEYAFFSLFTHSVLSAARSEIKAKTKLPLEQVFLLVVTKREIKAYSSKKKKKSSLENLGRVSGRARTRSRHTVHTDHVWTPVHFNENSLAFIVSVCIFVVAAAFFPSSYRVFAAHSFVCLYCTQDHDHEHSHIFFVSLPFLGTSLLLNFRLEIFSEGKRKIDAISEKNLVAYELNQQLVTNSGFSKE